MGEPLVLPHYCRKLQWYNGLPVGVYVAYQPLFPEKTAFVPLPINLHEIVSHIRTVPEKLNSLLVSRTLKIL